MIDMIMPIHIENKKVILEEDSVLKLKLIRENIKQDLINEFGGLKVVHFYKTSPFRRVTSKIRKKVKHGEF